MRCTRPYEMFITPDGPRWVETGDSRAVKVRCGICMGCRVTRQRDWMQRIVHETRMHQVSAFVTLTFKDEHRKRDLDYTDFQLFMQRLRHKRKKEGRNGKWIEKVGKDGKTKREWKSDIRFFAVGEYGKHGINPHWHACIFGVWFDDPQVWRQKKKTTVWRSKELEALWPYGYTTFGLVEPASAKYVAKYTTKIWGGKGAEEHYKTVDPETGEIFTRKPELARMSLKPGIGFGFLDKYREEMYRHGFNVVQGRKVPIPRAYDLRVKSMAPEEWALIEKERYEKSLDYEDKDYTRERLDTIEAVAIAKHKFYNSGDL